MRIKKRFLIPAVIIAVYAFGPRKDFQPIDSTPSQLNMPLTDLTAWVTAKDANVSDLKPDNETRLIWADSVRQTPYSVVYLHGFSASPMEGNPVHIEFAERYGCNLYIPRLPQHGISNPETFSDLEPAELINAAKEAVAVGQLIGEKVILMSCSTGSTLSLYLASETPDDIEALIMFAPNIDLHNNATELLTMPWGPQLAQVLVGKYRSLDGLIGTPKAQYTTVKYRSEGLIALKALIESTMTEDVLKKVKQPFFIGYYYEDDEHCDQVISIDKIKWFESIAATPAEQKRVVPIPGAKTHVIPSGLHSKDIPGLQKAVYSFTEEVLGL